MVTEAIMAEGPASISNRILWPRSALWWRTWRRCWRAALFLLR